MWNLLAGPNPAVTYKPTAFTDSSSAYTDEAKAYDADEYPWSTFGYGTHSGSAVSATYEDNILLYSTFGTLSKANFSSAQLEIVASFSLDSGGLTGSTKITTAALDVQYSVNGGTSWLNVSQYGSGFIRAGYPYGNQYVLYPAQYYDVAYSTVVPGDLASRSGTKVPMTVAIPSTAFSAGIQDLQVRFVLSTISVTSHSSSTGSLYVYDIRAIVS